MVIFSALFGLFVLPFALLFDQSVFQIGTLNISTLALSGFLYIVGLIPYLWALDLDEVSIVIPIFQTIPVFGFIYAYFVLGETLTPQQIFASILIITGAIGISLDLSQGMPKLKKKVLFYMLLASAIFAGVDLLFKFIAVSEGFWAGMFWHFTGYLIFAIPVLIFVRKYRQQFLRLMRENKVLILSVNSINETLNLVARGMFGYATLLAPLALVQVVNGFQPFFVFIYGVVLTLFFPPLGAEKLIRKNVVQKILAIIVIFIGTYFLNA